MIPPKWTEGYSILHNDLIIPKTPPSSQAAQSRGATHQGRRGADRCAGHMSTLQFVPGCDAYGRRPLGAPLSDCCFSPPLSPSLSLSLKSTGMLSGEDSKAINYLIKEANSEASVPPLHAALLEAAGGEGRKRPAPQVSFRRIFLFSLTPFHFPTPALRQTWPGI